MREGVVGGGGEIDLIPLCLGSNFKEVTITPL